MKRNLFALALILALAVPVFPANFSIAISPAMFKSGTNRPNRSHRWVYIAEGLAAAASLGLDGYSTERAIARGLHETNPLFIDQGGRFSQYKFWSFKSAGAALPFLATYIGHKQRKDSELTDIVSIAGSGLVTALFTSDAIHNIRLK